MEFKEIFLGDHVTIKSSKRIFLKDYVENGVPFYRSKEIILKFNKQNIDETLYISEELYSSVKSKYGVPLKNDILLTSVGTLGVPYLVKEGEKFYFKDGNLTWFSKFDANVLLPEYLFYWIQSDIGKSSINSISIGSTQKALTMESLKKLKINVPPIIEQKWVISILSSIDEKIVLNNSILSNLDKLSQLLFKHWFLDFEFPNEKGQPYKSSGGEMVESELGMIPAGWHRELLSNISKHKKDTITMNKVDSEFVHHFSIPNFDSSKMSTKDRVGDIKSSKYRINEKSLLFSKLNPITPRIWNPVIPKDGLLCVASTEFVILESLEKELKCFILSLISSTAFTNFLLGQVKGSTGSRQRVSPSDAIKYPFAFNKEIAKNFSETVLPIYENIQLLRLENENLKLLRDTLLPKLLSGEIEVPVEAGSSIS